MIRQSAQGSSTPHLSKPCLSINCFGHFHVTQVQSTNHSSSSNESRPELPKSVRFETNKTRALLAYLAVESEQPHTRDKLTGLFWPEFPEKKARHSLRQTLVRMRQSIGDQNAKPPYLLITRQTIQMNQSSNYWVDTGEFRQLLSGKPSVTNLDQAAQVYQEEFLTGFSLPGCEVFEEWLLLARERYHRQVTEVLQRLVDIYMGLEDYLRVQKYTQRLLLLNPWHESIHAQRMMALALEGQRTAALLQYEECKRILMQEFGTPPDETTTALYKQIIAGHISANPAEIQRHSHNIPSPTAPMFGRKAELQKICTQLKSSECRLISLVGLGGVGKSRLAIAVAEEVCTYFEHGVWFVSMTDSMMQEELATQRSLTHMEDILAVAIADAVGLQISNKDILRNQLFFHLQLKKTLLIFDNFEHLNSASSFVLEILKLAPFVSILITTRSQLNIQAEYIINLSGLPTPIDSSTSFAPTSSLINSSPNSLQKMMGYSSIRLFAARADRTSIGFSLNKDNLPYVIQICQLLNGLPLGIELAALWTEHFTCAEISESIQTNLDFLTTSHRDIPQRHRSLRAVLDYSWHLLTQTERELIAQLSIFQSEFSRDAAMKVTQGTLAGLVTLTRHSLIHATDAGRYQMHEMVRLFATEKFSALAHSAPLQERHSHYHLELILYEETALVEPIPKKDLDNIQAKFADIHQAWQWAIAHQQFKLLDRSAVGLKELYTQKGLFHEGQMAFLSAIKMVKAQRQQLESALSEQNRADISYRDDRIFEEKKQMQLILAKFLLIEAHFCSKLNKNDQVAVLASEAIDIASANHATTLEIIGYLVWGRALLFYGNYKVAKVYINYAQMLARQYQLSKFEIMALNALGFIHMNYAQKNYADAKSYLERALRLCRKNNLWQMEEADTLFHLSILFDYVGISQKAIRYAQQALAISTQSDRVEMAGAPLAFLSLYTSQLGNYEQALDYNQQALQIARQEKNPELEAHVHLFHGDISIKRGHFQDATESFEQALYLIQSLGLTHLSVISWAGFSKIALAQKNNEQALFYVEKILSSIEDNELNVREPLSLYLTCYEVLEASSDRRARAILQAAYHLLQEQAMTITDEKIRSSFLENVSTNRTIRNAILTPNTRKNQQSYKYLNEKVRPDLKHLDYLLYEGHRFRLAPTIHA